MVVKIELDYGSAGDPDLLNNLSGISAAGEFLWSVSDEGRTVECLQKQGDCYALKERFQLDDYFHNLPGLNANGGAAELDIESIDVVDGALWLCGSHCNVRKNRIDTKKLSEKIISRPSRHFLAKIALKPNGGFGKAKKAPASGDGALRSTLSMDPFLAPFIDLPSKENGLDIEGLVIFETEVLFGLRGPVLDGMAVVVHAKLDDDLELRKYRLSFLNLGGLAVRDLTRHKDKILIVAGPVGDALAPFKLFAWAPVDTNKIQTPVEIHAWAESSEKPEGISQLKRSDVDGWLVVYDHPNMDRLGARGTYLADWIHLTW
jgi:hypothetical protein